ncbi:MAG: hypothetical protein KJ941_03180 [Bacteroidetes bacterium]|nr:hypothetical protein [Bacteroidota bacterium]
MNKTTLVIIYNHRFDRNIPIIDELYGSRFSKIYHLVPFYDGDRPNVIPVFETSFYFQGYIPQAAHVLNKLDCDNFLFIGDDVILNPEINEFSVHEIFRVKQSDGFIPWSWGFAQNMSLEYANSIPAINAMKMQDILLHHVPDIHSHIPNLQDYKEKLKKHNLFPNKKIKFKHVFGETKLVHSKFKQSIKIYFKQFFKNEQYPLLASYSDIFIVSKDNFLEFSRICEITRQSRLWVEFAIPLAVLSSHEKVVFEEDINWTGTTYWDKVWKGSHFNPKQNKSSSEFKLRFPNPISSLDELNSTFNENELYIHPIKLSQLDI